MTISFDLTGEAERLLQERAKTLNISVEELAAAVVRDMVASPESDFDAAAKRVLEKNRELYRRLS